MTSWLQAVPPRDGLHPSRVWRGCGLCPSASCQRHWTGWRGIINAMLSAKGRLKAGVCLQGWGLRSAPVASRGGVVEGMSWAATPSLHSRHGQAADAARGGARACGVTAATWQATGGRRLPNVQRCQLILLLLRSFLCYM